MSRARYSHLLAPGSIGKLALRNRIAVTAMGVNLAEADGTCGERLLAYHGEQARGGAGLIITGATGVAWPSGGVIPNQMAISEDRFIPGIAALADRVHAHGAKLALQLHHGGANAVEDMAAARPMWVPSIPSRPSGDVSAMLLPEELAVAAGRIRSIAFKVLDSEDICTLVEQFAFAAQRAQRAGVDGLEIHGGHGYLLAAFLSPHKNKRDDEYGGPLENRARLLLQVVRAVRAAVGPDLAVWCKLDAREEGLAGGITLEDAIATARLVEAAGADAITVSAYHDTGQGKLHSASHTPHSPALNLPAAAAIKAAVTIPILASGRVEPALGDAAIAAGRLDFLAMGRPLLADPQLPAKLAANREDDVLPCVYCYTCISAIYNAEPTRCAVNPHTGREHLLGSHSVDRSASPPARRLHLAVVGGGPAGMEAARRLDLAGHRVSLLEQDRRLGGSLQFAALTYAANERLLAWLRRRISASAVELHLATRATSELLRNLRPDSVFVATGARRVMPSLPGADQSHVYSGDDMRALLLGGDGARRIPRGLARAAVRLAAALGLTRSPGLLRRATRLWMPFGRDIVVVGGELVGLELAEFLHERGRRVSVVESASHHGRGLSYVRRMRLLEELQEQGVGLYTSATELRIEADAVRFSDAAGQPRRIAADQVIVAQGATADLGLAERLRSDGFDVHSVGDCSGVAYIEGAMRDAAEVVDALLREVGAAGVEPGRSRSASDLRP